MEYEIRVRFRRNEHPIGDGYTEQKLVEYVGRYVKARQVIDRGMLRDFPEYNFNEPEIVEVAKPAKTEAKYSLSGEDAYTLLTGEHNLSMTGANGLIFLAAAFGEVRIPFEGLVMAVGYAGGYYSVTPTRLDLSQP
jgi:hypothetical protein